MLVDTRVITLGHPPRLDGLLGSFVASGAWTRGPGAAPLQTRDLQYHAGRTKFGSQTSDSWTHAVCSIQKTRGDRGPEDIRFQRAKCLKVVNCCVFQWFVRRDHPKGRLAKAGGAI